MSYPPQQPPYGNQPPQWGPPVQWGGAQPGPVDQRRRGAPWWLVIVLGVVAVALLAGLLVSLLTGRGVADAAEVRLPDELGGLPLATGDEQTVDRDATREEILERTGAGGDVAVYEEDGDEMTVYVVRHASIPGYNVVPREEDDATIEVRQVGEAACNVSTGRLGGGDDEETVYGCGRTGERLTVSVSSTDLDQDAMVEVVDDLWAEFS